MPSGLIAKSFSQRTTYSARHAPVDSAPLHLALGPGIGKHAQSPHAPLDAPQSLAARNLSVAKTLVFPAIHIEYWRHLFFTVTPGLFVDRLYNIARTLSEHRQLTDEWLRDARLVQVR